MKREASFYTLDVYNERLVLDPALQSEWFSWNETAQVLLIKLPPATVLACPLIITNQRQDEMQVTLELAEGAQLECGFAGRGGDKMIRLDATATLKMMMSQCGTEKVEVHLAGEGAKFSLTGLMHGQGKAQHHYDLCMYHEADETVSQVEMRGIAEDQSDLRFRGLIYIVKHVKDVAAGLQTRNLLLSNRASIDAKPELEIYSNEVACQHGASVGNLDESALFYLQSRGCSLEEARLLLIESFKYAAFGDGSVLAQWVRYHCLGGAHDE